MREWIDCLRIGDKIESDHHPLEVYIKGKQGSRKEGEGVKSYRGVWNEEGRNI